MIEYHRLPENDVDQIKASLAVAGIPVLFSFLTSPEYEALNRGSRDPVVSYPPSRPLGRHVNLIVGYADSRKAFRVRNSWGTRFGDNGHCWLPYDYVADMTLANDFWRIDHVEA